MENGQKTIRELFDGKKIFKIPEYQRAYTWGEKQLSDFIEDLKYQKLDKDYFFGTILFQETGIDRGFEVIEIVDGQQRITTLILFINEVLRLSETLDERDKSMDIDTFIKSFGTYKLEVLGQDNEFFKSYILEDNIVQDSYISTPSQKKLLYAKEYFNTELKKYSQVELEEFRNKISNTKLLSYSVNNKSEATLIFETTNDRGKQLTNLEKTKSFLMYKIYLCSNNPDIELEAVQSRFMKIYNDYSCIENEIDENSILQYHFIAFEEWKTGEVKEYQRYMEIVKERVNILINTEGNDTKAIAYINRYSRELRESFAIMKELFNWESKELKDIIILSNIANFYPLILKSYKLDTSTDKQDVKSILRLLEIYSFRVYGIQKGRTNTGQTRFYALARDFKGDFVKLRADIKGLLKEYSDEKRFVEELRRYDFYNRHSSKIKNYFFWKYENYLRKNEQPIAQELGYKDYLNTDKKTKFSIEHIIPQTPDNKYRKIITEELMYDTVDEIFEENYLHSIGNLTIDPLSANISKQNVQFQVKNGKYFKKAPFKSQNELDSFLENEKFTVSSINKRSEKLITFALDYWKI